MARLRPSNETTGAVSETAGAVKEAASVVISELFVLAAALQHSARACRGEGLQKAILEIGDIVCRLQELNKASQQWSTASGCKQSDKASIEVVEHLFSSSSSPPSTSSSSTSAASRAAEAIAKLLSTPFEFRSDARIKASQPERQEMWNET